MFKFDAGAIIEYARILGDNEKKRDYLEEALRQCKAARFGGSTSRSTESLPLESIHRLPLTQAKLEEQIKALDAEVVKNQRPDREPIEWRGSVRQLAYLFDLLSMQKDAALIPEIGEAEIWSKLDGVFCTRRGKPITREDLKSAFHDYFKNDSHGPQKADKITRIVDSVLKIKE